MTIEDNAVDSVSRQKVHCQPVEDTLDIDSLPYRPCAGIVLINKDKKIFVGERIDLPGSWQMPQGGIEGDEPLDQAILRELHEEVGTNCAEIIRIADKKLRYDIPKDRIPVFWSGQYRGQEQIWAALRFTGTDNDIILDAYHTPEFLQWKWVTPNEALDLIVPFKKPLYEEVFEMFQDLL